MPKYNLIEEETKPAHTLGHGLFSFYPCRKDGLFVEKLAFTAADILFTLLFKEVAILEIKKNISATLKREMDKRGLNFMEFSTELGIPRTTLQGYLKGTSSPRADTLEELAEKLGISPAELVAGNEYPNSMGISCLDSVLLELPSLHPLVLPAAENAVSILQYVFRLSSNLNALDERTVPEEPPDAVYRYFLHDLKSPLHPSPNYGILMKERFAESWATIAVVAPFSHDRAAVMQIIRQCTKLQLSPEHLLDVVQDFLTQRALSP